MQLRATTLLLVLCAAAVPLGTSARLIINMTSAEATLASVQTLMTLPKEQLLVGVSDNDFLAVLAKALDVVQALVQDKVDHQSSLFDLTMSVAAKALDGQKDIVVQALGLNNSFVLKYPTALPNLTSAFPAPFNITDFPTMPWLNRNITIKGFPTYDILNWTMGLLTPQIPILMSKLILSNNFTQASLVVNSTKKA
jgi:hypothetical protein